MKQRWKSVCSRTLLIPCRYILTSDSTVRTQNTLLQPLYINRQQTVSKIPNFWPLVLEQAPPDIDQYIQPSDSALLLSSLVSLSVSRFEPTIDPRSVAIKFEFKENEHFSNDVLEKRFWYRRDAKGFAGLVSEPVKIDWKSKEKDLTGGLLDLVVRAWEEETAANGAADKQKKKGGEKKLTPLQKQLATKISKTATGGSSFFAWFGYIGRRVSAEESAIATQKEKEEREALKAGKTVEPPASKDVEEEDDDEEMDDLSYELEIFPDGDDLAVAISEDLWPGALKYFSKFMLSILLISFLLLSLLHLIVCTLSRSILSLISSTPPQSHNLHPTH